METPWKTANSNFSTGLWMRHQWQDCLVRAVWNNEKSGQCKMSLKIANRDFGSFLSVSNLSDCKTRKNHVSKTFGFSLLSNSTFKLKSYRLLCHHKWGNWRWVERQKPRAVCRQFSLQKRSSVGPPGANLFLPDSPPPSQHSENPDGNVVLEWRSPQECASTRWMCCYHSQQPSTFHLL